MLKSLHIQNFRGFRDLKIDSLKRVNLITGQNNTGKTGVLEALVLLLGDPDSNQRQLLPNLFRSIGGDYQENFWKWLFNKKNLEKNINILGGFDNQENWLGILQSNVKTPIDVDSILPAVAELPDSLRHSSKVGNFDFYIYSTSRGRLISPKPAIFSTKPSEPRENAIKYNRVVLKRCKRKVEEMLRQIEPRLVTIEALQVGELGQQATPLIFAEISGLNEMIPVTQLGQGFNRLLDIYSEIVVADAKVLLIDEIENGLHYSVLPVIWKGLFLAAQEFDVQIFATTHSWECILAADQTARERENYELELIRLDRVKDDIKATIIDKDALETAKNLGWEMR